MSSAIKRMGVLYGKLGLSTDPVLIERRAEGVREAAKALKIEEVPAMLRTVFGLFGAQAADFLEIFSDNDPTFDVQPGTREASLLACVIAAHKMEAASSISGKLALALVTTSVGGMRPPQQDDQLVALGETILAERQGLAVAPPKDRSYLPQPESLKLAIHHATQAGTPQMFSQTGGHYLTSLQELATYTESVAKHAATSDKELVTYVQRLEEEVRIYWWVVGGWSTDGGKPFRTFNPAEAAVRAGKELASKTSVPIGLFAAPALIDMVVEHGRRTASKPVSLADAATAADRAWRAATFEAVSSGAFANLLPFSYMQSLAATSGDADDWHPRFKRETGLDLTRKIDLVHLGIQVYRECLTLRMLRV